MSFSDSLEKFGQSAKNFGSSFKDMGGNAANGAEGLKGVALFGAKVAGFFVRIPMFLARKGLDLGAGLNRNPVTGTIIGAGIIGGAIYGVYKAAKYALGYREETDKLDAVSAQKQLEREKERGAMIDSHLGQIAQQEEAMYRNMGNWAKNAPQPSESKAQAAMSEQSQTLTAPAPR